MCRPAKYADFDPNQDHMHVIDLQREEEIKDQIRRIETSVNPIIIRGLNVRNLKDQLPLCRIRVMVEDFDENMRKIGNLLADRIYTALTVTVKDINELKGFESEMNDSMLESYKTQGYPEFIEDKYGWITSRIDEDKKDKFLRNCGKIYFALAQKYIPVRRGELP